MNLKSLLCGLSALAMLTACSNDEPGNGGNGNGGNDGYVDAGYLTIGIEMPQTKGSRANNDNYDHGLTSEYAVENAMLILFTGNTEAAAKYHSAYDLTMIPGGVNGGSNPDVNITTSYLKTVHLNNVADDAHLWGLVLVNYNGVATRVLDETVQEATGTMKPSDVFKGLVETLSINGNTVAPGTTFGDLRKEISNNSFINNNYFFMTNAVLSKVEGENNQPDASQIYTLQEIGVASAHTYATEAEAATKPAASFYVERAVAKATLTWSNTLAGDLLASANVLGIESIEWLLDNTEPTSYIVRNNTGDNVYVPYLNQGKYRFIGNVKIGQTAIQPTANLYRHYWALDPNYDRDATLTTAIDQNMVNASAPAFFATGSDKPQYCHENTFDVAHMNYRNSTRAVLKVTFKMPEDGDGNLWVVNNVSNNTSADNIFKTETDATSNVIRAIVESHDVRDAAKAALKDGATWSVNTTNYNDKLDIKFELNPVTNVYFVKSVSFKDNDAFTATPAPFTSESALVKNINATFTVVKYEGGVAYYDIRFKHFGDEYCAWTAPGQTTTNTNIAYGNNAEKYLGRWGMVRNNWYEINVSSIKQLGKPVIGNLYVEDDTTPDDNNEVEKWLSFKINILSWAKRVQNEEL